MKIIQLILSPSDDMWQGKLVGLGDDGAIYVREIAIDSRTKPATGVPYWDKLDIKVPPSEWRDEERKACGMEPKPDVMY